MSKLMGALLVLMSTLAQADDLLVIRADGHRGGKPGMTFGVITPKFEAWCFNQPQFPLWEFGRTEYWQLGKRTGVLAGGYLSYWEKPHQWYVEPWSQWHQSVGTTKFTAKLAAYAPLSRGGNWWLYSDQTAVTWPVGKGVNLGIATDWWLVSGSKPAAGLGAVLSFPVGKANVALRALHGFNEADSVRMEVSCPF